jgi:hypothetical protein
MKPLMLVGLILVIPGVLAFAYQGGAYVTTGDAAVRATVEADRARPVPLWPFVSGACMVVGVILMAVSASHARA